MTTNRYDSASARGADDAIAIWRGGVRAVLGDRAVERVVSLAGGYLVAADQRSDLAAIDLAAIDRLLIVGAGKATATMAAGLLRVIGDQLPYDGAINVPEAAADGLDLGHLRVCQARPQGCNEPTQLAIDGTRSILDLVSRAGRRDLCVTLLSGGASALLVAPPPSISLNDKLAVTRQLSAAGATIEELNAVRRQISLVKGGGLARASQAQFNLTLALSDVIGDPLDVIGSGPTVPSRSTASDALKLLAHYDRNRRLPAAIYQRLESSAAAPVSPDLTPSQPVVLVGNNAAAAQAAGANAKRLGYQRTIEVAAEPEGTAEQVGRRLAEVAIEWLTSGSPQPVCLITGGEPTVQLPPPEIRGSGGRNQQLVLAAMVALQQHPRFHPQHRSRLTILAAGTDGEDGPTDAAGAVLTSEVWQAAERLTLSANDYLNRADAYRFFDAAGGLLRSGPTGTNVCDLRVVLIQPAAV